MEKENQNYRPYGSATHGERMDALEFAVKMQSGKLCSCSEQLDYLYAIAVSLTAAFAYLIDAACTDNAEGSMPDELMDKASRAIATASGIIENLTEIRTEQ